MQRSERGLGAIPWLAIATLALVGFGSSVLSPIALKFLLPRLAFPFGSAIASIEFDITLFSAFGFGIALVLTTRSALRASGFAFSFTIAACSLGYCLNSLANDGENAWLVLALTMATITLSATCALLLARSFADTDRGVSPFVLFAYYFLGRLVGTLSYPFFIEPMFALQSQVYGIVATLLVTAVAFLGLSAWQTVPGPMEAKQKISNAWLRYARWFVLGGLPVCVASGATDYIATEISPIPVMWLVPLSLYVASFVVAFSRMARPASALHMAIPQFLVAIALLAPACWLLWSLSERLIDSELAVMSAVVGLAIAVVLMPHRATLVVQCLLVAIIVMQIYGGQPIHAGSSFGVMWHLATHVLCSAVISWGCIGDAVGEAQDGDRLAEFLVCIHAGAVVYGFAYQKILPILIPPDWGLVEYPVVLVGSLAVRAWVLYGRASLVGNS